MRNVLICTVGTSLIGNIEKSDDLKLKELIRNKNVKGLTLALADLNPSDRMTGAEINSIASILDKKILDERAYLYLLVSDTEDGEFIGNVLKGYFERKQNPLAFEKVIVRRITGLMDESPKRFRSEGLRNLVREIAQIVRTHDSSSILINATGGYKAQISFAGMIGQALEIPVCYLFERFSEVIELPPQPISLDMAFWLSNASLFYDLAGEGIDSDPSETEPRFSSLMETIEEDGQKLTSLSATGQLFHETFLHLFEKQRAMLLPPDSGLAPEDKIIKFEDQNARKHKGLKEYLNKIRQVSYVIRIYTHYYNPDLPLKNYFRLPKDGDVSKIEGGYGDGKRTTKFEIVTTAKRADQRNAAIADLYSTIG